MAETEDRWQATVAEVADSRQAPPVGGRSEGSRAMTAAAAGAVAALLLVVPAAFVAGWRLGRSVGRLTGH